jgi:phosphohistidine phosphatase SixA
VNRFRWTFLPRAALCGAIVWIAGCTQQQTTTHTKAGGESAVATHTVDFVNVHALIIVRHADISVDQKRKQGDATPLLPSGEARAKQLAAALKDAGITRVFTTQTERTENTARIGVGGKLPVESPFVHKADAADVLDYLAGHTRPDDVVLLVENHGSIKELLGAMGYPEESLIDENTEFDRCYVVLPDVQAHRYRVLRLRFGGNWGK